MTPERPLKDLLAKLIALRIGARTGVGAEQLAQMLVVSPRTLRALITQLRDEGMPICGTPETGYFIAETPEELSETLSFLRSRALRSLHLEARLRKCSLASLLGQMHLDLEKQSAP